MGFGSVKLARIYFAENRSRRYKMVNLVIKGLYFGSKITELRTKYLLVFTLQLAAVI